MKKLSVSLAAMACVVASNAATMNFGYCGEPMGAIGTADPGPLTTAAAVLLTTDELKDYVGNNITGVQFVLGENLANYDVTIFLTHALDEKPFATKDVTGAPVWTVGMFDQAYTITGDKPVYFGYLISSVLPQQFPICVDQRGQSAHVNGGYFVIRDDKEGVDNIDNIFQPPTSAWQPSGMQFGNICARVVLEGDNLPVDQGEMLASLANQYVRAGDTFEVQAAIQNRASNDISSVKVSYKVGKDPQKSAEISLDTPIPPGEMGIINVPMSYASTQKNLQILMSLTEVNGKQNQFNGGCVTSTYCVEGLYKRNIVAEANTGANCELAPIGLVAIDKMSEAHPDDFIGINIHNYAQRDEMYCSSYNNWDQWSKINGEAPLCMVNRNTSSVGVFDTQYEILEDIHNTLTRGSGSPFKLEFSTSINGEKNIADATVYTSGCIDMSSLNCGIEFVLVQDKIGPYNQKNAWARKIEGFPPLEGWDDKGEIVSTVFDNVAIQSIDFNGRPRSVPSEIKAGEIYKYEKPLSILECTRLEGASLDNVSVVCMIVDKSTREIMNAAKATLGGKTSGYDAAVAGVGNVTIDGVDVYGAESSILVKGEYDKAEVYSISGAHVASFNGEESVAVAPGIYVVRVSSGCGVASFKVIVR